MITQTFHAYDGKFYILQSSACSMLQKMPVLTYPWQERAYCYRLDRFCNYGMEDQAWTEYCGISQ